VRGILADVHMGNYVEAIVREMQSAYWAELWTHLGLTLHHFDDMGLTPTSTDLEIWQRCQAEQLILITDNRNQYSDDSLESAIRDHNTPDSLPVFTIGKLARLRKNNTYAQLVVEKIYGYLLDIDRVRGAGRLYLP
jgi:predicted nuclease of predicted toxin-antitoxin system